MLIESIDKNLKEHGLKLREIAGELDSARPELKQIIKVQQKNTPKK